MRELERVHRTRKKGEGACELGVLMKIRALGLFRRLFEEATTKLLKVADLIGMQPSLFIVFVLLSCSNAARIKVKKESFSSSSQSSCRVLAKWICQPKTYKENLGQVGECCKANDVGNEELRKACCELAGLTNEGVNATVAESITPVKKDPVVVVDTRETEPEIVENTAEDIQDELVSPREPTSLSPKLDDDLLEILGQGIWRTGFDMVPNLEKKLVQAFYSPRKPGLSWSMSSVEECEKACESQGGQCQAIQSEEDCRTAASRDLGKSFAPLITQADKDQYPVGCFVKAGKAHANRVRWNPPSLDRPTVKISSVCGCYK